MDLNNTTTTTTNIDYDSDSISGDAYYNNSIYPSTSIDFTTTTDLDYGSVSPSTGWTTTTTTPGTSLTWVTSDELEPYRTPTFGFNKSHRKLPYDKFLVVLETMKEDDYDNYLESLADVIVRPAFRILPEEFLIENIKDIEEIEKLFGIDISDYYNLDDFYSFRLLKTLNK
jgi:hypothetical protein